MAPDARELFEASSPLARMLTGCTEPTAEARRLISGMNERDKVATLNAHPRIGERPDRMSERSLTEQGEGPTPAELAGLNAEYEERFGFRFVVFVAGRSKAEIVSILRERIRHTREEEMTEGLAAIVDIAEDRLRSRSR